jgi:gluconokinase
MHHGQALTDEDRQGWLEALRDHETAHPPGATSWHLVMTCSALKRHYRDILRRGSEQAQNLRVRFVYLDAPEEVLTARATARKGHFAGSNLVHSQFESLEPPEVDEKDVHTLNVDRSVEEVEADAVKYVREILAG